MPRYAQVLRQWCILLAPSDREWFNLLGIREPIPGRRPHKRIVLSEMGTLSHVFPIKRQKFDGQHRYSL